MFTPKEVAANYLNASETKAKLPFGRMFVLAILAGMFIAVGGLAAGVGSATATGSAARLISGAVFPAGLAMVLIAGSELFTGNCLMIMGVLSRRITARGMFRNFVVVWLGGNALSSPWAASEFNMMQDIAAGRVVIGSGVPFVQLPCMGVVDHFATGRWELEHYLVGKGPLCDYLAKNTIAEAERISAWKAWTRVIWDVTAIAWLIDENRMYLLDEKKPRFMPNYDKQYEYDREREEFVYVFHVYRDALFDDLFGRLTYYESL